MATIFNQAHTPKKMLHRKLWMICHQLPFSLAGILFLIAIGHTDLFNLQLQTAFQQRKCNKLWPHCTASPKDFVLQSEALKL